MVLPRAVRVKITDNYVSFVAKQKTLEDSGIVIKPELFYSIEELDGITIMEEMIGDPYKEIEPLSGKVNVTIYQLVKYTVRLKQD